MRKTIHQGRPSLILATLGGAAGLVFHAATLQVGAGADAAGLGMAEALGGIWPTSLLGLLVGWLGLPTVAIAVWKKLPGHRESLPGALLRGILFGLGVWLLAGVVLGLIGARGGWFGAGLGPSGVLRLVVASLGYGLILATIAAMGRGMAPLEALGWEGHGAGRAA